MLSPIVRDFKDNAVGNVVTETGRDLVFMTTARLSDLSMPLKGEVRRSPEQSARQPIAEIGAMLLFFMLLKSAILCDLYLLTYIICAIETPCDANLFLPFVSIHFFNSRCYF